MWLIKPTINTRMFSESTLFGEYLYKKQMEDIEDLALLGYCGKPSVNSCAINPKPAFTFLGRGEVVAGSSVSHLLNKEIIYNDFDIYFHHEDDAKDFMKLNKLKNAQLYGQQNNLVCISSVCPQTINLIWHIPYSSPADLISEFDIRACAVAIDPYNDMFYAVDGALNDCFNKAIIWQPSCRSATVKRLQKYLGKGFIQDKYQRNIFAELIKAGKHDTNLELFERY
jgi:hypothetical protein